MNFILFLRQLICTSVLDLALFIAQSCLSSVKLPDAGQLLVFAAQSSELYFSDRFYPSDPLLV